MVFAVTDGLTTKCQKSLRHQPHHWRRGAYPVPSTSAIPSFLAWSVLCQTCGAAPARQHLQCSSWFSAGKPVFYDQCSGIRTRNLALRLPGALLLKKAVVALRWDCCKGSSTLETPSNPLLLRCSVAPIDFPRMWWALWSPRRNRVFDSLL